jgi:uncharacterized BrkB/YihY/UPF0761 family membrane protein
MDEGFQQHVLDDEHIRLLGVCYKISALLAVGWAMLGILPVVVGLTAGVLSGATIRPNEPPAPTGGLTLEAIFAIGLVLLLGGILLAVLRWSAARRLARRKDLFFCQTVAALGCLEFPFGTALGFVTFQVLSRPSVRCMFNRPFEGDPVRLTSASS